MNVKDLTPTIVVTFNGGPMNYQQRTVPNSDIVVYSDGYIAPARYARQGKKWDGTWIYKWLGHWKNEESMS